ncbi:carboxylesterase/lipase family protein [Streptoalloteichus hindustanus]|uniref:Carboxylic ester hydrolase n=1 Tax=Streptoalloteichus hindustanus TaxID=2017 RepID=A0A1M5I3E2_STRHI|nr:carboxylesterase family protein [Streptoalloteichus hindustanus]SHG22742.1 para-nitrobenzyl esterase [Streptoalloteichus hindustanus]
MTRRQQRGWSLSFAALALTTALPLPASGAGVTTQDSAVVRTDRGAVRGVEHADYREFHGIPFAAPPVGELRWRSPRPHAPWTGTRDATKPGARCAQLASVTGTPASNAEDCLYLTVTAPRPVGRGPKPVMVWLHGGGFVEGAGSEYDPHRIAVRGDVLVVTVNYRLGIFSNFAHPGLDGSGAFGLEDQQAALRWVRRNAVAFGGDPGNVTLFGQSAGGQSVCAQLAAPGAAGLFHRAVIQSSLCTTKIPANALAPGLPTVSPWETVESVAARGRQTATALRCPDPATALTCLRDLPPEQLMPVFGQFAGLSYGSRTLPEDPYRVLREGRMHRMPVLSGTTRDEMTFMQAVIDLSGGPLTARRYRQYLDEAFGVDADRVAARYPLRPHEPPSRTWAAVTTDSALTCPTLNRSRLFARHVPTYGYEFADRTVPPTLPDVGYPYGAYHSADLFSLFDLRDGAVGPELDAQQRRLGDLMIDYWTAFARTANPNAPGLPRWPRLRPNTPAAQSLATGPHGVGPVDLAQEHHCQFWDSVSALR